VGVHEIRFLAFQNDKGTFQGQGAAASGFRLVARQNNPRFEPFEFQVAPGDTIQVTNTGSDRHTFTSVDEAFKEVEVAAGESEDWEKAAPFWQSYLGLKRYWDQRREGAPTTAA
jgi:plastocyanin